MIGPYSVNQMDDFYPALASGQVKPTGMMNYIQRLYIAERCPPGAASSTCAAAGGSSFRSFTGTRPTLPPISAWTSPGRISPTPASGPELDRAYGKRPFRIEFAECDVAEPWPRRRRLTWWSIPPRWNTCPATGAPPACAEPLQHLPPTAFCTCRPRIHRVSRLGCCSMGCMFTNGAMRNSALSLRMPVSPSRTPSGCFPRRQRR